MTPEVFQTQKLLQLFYSCNPARLNKQGEGLLKLVTFDQENSTPEELIYIIDDCIKPEDNAFKAAEQILATLLSEVLSEVSDGAMFSTIGQEIHFLPLLELKTLEELVREIHKSKPFGNFTLN